MRKDARIPHGRKGEVLRPESARSLLWAERYARIKGRWLNTWITISFPSSASPRKGKSRKWKDAYGNKRIGPYLYRTSKDAYEIFREMWDAARRRWNRTFGNNGQNPFDAMAVFERKVVKAKVGTTRHSGPIHVHWLLRWPKNDWDRLLYFIRRKLAKAVSGMIERDVHLKAADYQVGLAKYMSKGIDPPYARTFYLRYQPQGRIDHRRIKVSRSLGPSMRKMDVDWHIKRNATSRSA